MVIGALALAGVLVGSIIAGQAGDPTPSASTAGSSVSPEVQAVTPTTPPPVGPPVAGPPAVAPTASAPPAAEPAAAALAMTVTCPSGAGASPRFGHQISAPTPYEITIDYGDGDVYTDTSDRLGAIFSHTYVEPGTYEVSAVLTDPTGRTTTGGCTYTWSG
ncbi:PKD domain-containing protein [Candidatus Blastococcus massiliensis]|uniref:PKD domain-containing protein n=1 Tax=Candidatus Blastococcus massiliensis TaxID=1470358 RepID=UPI0004B750EC|nr:PKD domain-containing protein [Candidatus Blastococcus massiliensis]